MPTCGDYIMHFLTLLWKVLFAIVPPAGMSLTQSKHMRLNHIWGPHPVSLPPIPNWNSKTMEDKIYTLSEHWTRLEIYLLPVF